MIFEGQCSLVIFHDFLDDRQPQTGALVPGGDVGFGQSLTALLRNAQTEFRGRVMGLRSMAIFGFTLGSMASGGMASLWGSPWAANMVGLSGIAMVVCLVLIAPKLRKL